VVYLDSSALVKLVIAEPESAALRRYLADEPERASCALARVEVHRAVRGHGSLALTRARRLLSRLHLVQIDELLDVSTLDPRICAARRHSSGRRAPVRRRAATIVTDRRMATAAGLVS
jgi:uncharacterized protein with PIN domain